MRIIRLTSLLAALLVLAACGGSSRLSKDEFTKKADAICAKYDAKAKAATQGATASPKALAKSIDKLIPLVKKEAGELKDLKPPKDLQDRYDRWIKSGEDEI